MSEYLLPRCVRRLSKPDGFDVVIATNVESNVRDMNIDDGDY